MRPGALSEHLKRNDSSNACVEEDDVTVDEEDDGEGELTPSEVLKQNHSSNAGVEKGSGTEEEEDDGEGEFCSSEVDENDAVPATFEKKLRATKSTVSFDNSINKKSSSDASGLSNTNIIARRGSRQVLLWN